MVHQASVRPAPPPRLALRRAAFFGPVLALTALAGWAGYDLIHDGKPLSGLDALLWVLATIGFGLGAMGAWSPVLGFMVRCLGEAGVPALEREARRVPLKPSGGSRTALLMPVYNEDPAQVFAGVAAMSRALARLDAASDLDIFILSDTRDPVIAAEEEAAFAARRAERSDAEPAIYYRRREFNHARKAGNIADFCMNWGRAYDHMIVLDADSLMSAESIRRLIALMERHPEVGLIQTVPYPVNRETLFARMLQFSARIYTPLSVRGLDAWCAGEGSYWGHNAIARVAAFMEHCDLPVLEGKPPLGGEILCHDIVEAALMRRGGLQVRILPDLGGSWEEMPTNLLDFVARERRWCEGNLQHARVLSADGLHWVSRLHLGLGVVGYLSAPLSLAILALTGLQLAFFADANGSAAGFELLTMGLFKEGAFLHPYLWLCLAAALLPRLVIVAAALADRATTRAQGGPGKVVGGLLLEQVFSTLMMSVTPVITCGFIFEVLTGRPSGWKVQARSDRGLSWSEAWANLRRPTWVGAAWGAFALFASPLLFLWTLPTTVGLLTAAPLAVWTSRLDLGLKARARGWFLTPEETSPPAEIADLHAARHGEPIPEPVAVPAESVPPVIPARMRPQRLRWTDGEGVREAA